MRGLLALVLIVATLLAPAWVGAGVAAAPPAQWQPGANLATAAFWEAFPGASVTDGAVGIDGAPEAVVVVDRWGPRLTVSGDFRLVATLQAATLGMATLALVDIDSDARRIEFGLDGGRVALGWFDDGSADPIDWQTFAVDDGLSPLTLSLARVGAEFELQLSGAEVTRFANPGIFHTDRLALGAQVADGNRLTLYGLDVQAPVERANAVHVERCAPPRLLIAGGESPDGPAALWWAWPDGDLLRQVEVRAGSQRSYLVAASPDGRWVTYYQRSSEGPADRFVVDTWVIDVATDQRVRLVEGNSPIAWIADSSAVVLGQRPYLMALVPGGELVPTEGQVLLADSMRASTSPDGRWRAGVATMPTGAAGVNIVDITAGELIMNIPTGRGAVQLAWSADSRRLAYTSGVDGANGLIWRLRIVDVAERSVALVEDTRDMDIHSVLWVRGTCS